MLAVDAPSAGTQAVLYLIALVFFAALTVIMLSRQDKTAALLPAGLTVFVIVFFWNAWAAS